MLGIPAYFHWLNQWRRSSRRRGAGGRAGRRAGPRGRVVSAVARRQDPCQASCLGLSVPAPWLDPA